LLIAGAITGAIIGIVTDMIVRRIKRMF